MPRRWATRSSSLHLYRIGQLTPTSGPAASKYSHTRRSIRGGRKCVCTSASTGTPSSRQNPGIPESSSGARTSSIPRFNRTGPLTAARLPATLPPCRPAALPPCRPAARAPLLPVRAARTQHDREPFPHGGRRLVGGRRPDVGVEDLDLDVAVVARRRHARRDRPEVDHPVADMSAAEQHVLRQRQYPVADLVADDPPC